MSEKFGDVILNSDGKAVVFWAIKIGILLSTPVTLKALPSQIFAHPKRAGYEILVVYGS